MSLLVRVIYGPAAEFYLGGAPEDRIRRTHLIGRAERTGTFFLLASSCVHLLIEPDLHPSW